MKKILLLLSFFLPLLPSCTENARVRNFGGTMKIDLPANTKFVNATWKQGDLWYIYRERREGELIETVTMKEESSFGLVQGSVVFREH